MKTSISNYKFLIPHLQVDNLLISDQKTYKFKKLSSISLCPLSELPTLCLEPSAPSYPRRFLILKPLGVALRWPRRLLSTALSLSPVKTFFFPFLRNFLLSTRSLQPPAAWRSYRSQETFSPRPDPIVLVLFRSFSTK